MKLLIPLLSVIAALYGLHHYLKTNVENSCEMTYMFEYPEYMKVPLNYTSSMSFPRYNLFVYAEGKYMEELSSQGYKGVPVLFIPGNAGSHRQVRSLASVALRISQSRQTKLHFNFFTIDFSEEISALYGGTLDEQIEFVFECIKHIQALYPVNKKLVLIGHSMGGVIAKAVFSLPQFEPSDISLIVTLASPHRKPVLALDTEIVALYEKIQHFWRYRLKPDIKYIPIISIGGGQRDFLVKSDLIYNNFDHGSALDIHALTTSIPAVWLSTDHLAIVWCKQLVLTICRSLFDFYSLENNEEIKDPAMVENVLKFHYVAKSAANNWPLHWFLPVHSFSSSGEWIEQVRNPWRFSRAKVLSSIYLLIPFSQGDNVLIVASGLVKGDWIFGCTQLSKGSSKTCTEGENLSNHGKIIPSRKANTERRMVTFKTQDLQKKGYLYLLVYIAAVNNQVEVLSEVYIEADRQKHFDLPSIERYFSFMPHRIFTLSLVEQIVFYNVTISRSVGFLNAVEFQLETRLCRAGSVVGQGLIKMHIPWSGETSYYHIRAILGGITRVPVIIHSLPPAHINPVVNLEFIFDPECSVVLSAKFPFYIITSEFVKFYGTYTIGYAVAVLFVLLSEQMTSVDSEGRASEVYRLIGNVSSFFILVVYPSCLHYLIRLSNSSTDFLLPKPDELDESYGYLSSFLLRTLLYFVSCGIILCAYSFIELSLRIYYVLFKFWKQKNILSTTQIPLDQKSKDKVQISTYVLVWTSVIGAICVGISSSLASIITSFYYYCKLASMHIRCKLEEDRRGQSAATFKWYFHSVLVLMWFIVVMLTCPGFLTWLKHTKFSLKLSKDVYMVPCSIMVISVSVLWQIPTPIVHKFKYQVVGLLIKIIALVTALYGISSIYRLLYYMAAVFSIVCIQQTWGYFNGLAYLKCD